MKNLKIISIALLFILPAKSFAQESYGNTLNVGLGSSYYRYIGYPVPVFHLDYEFQIANSFTLAPSISVLKYNNEYWWGSREYPYRYYHYTQTLIPVGFKGTYYF